MQTFFVGPFQLKLTEVGAG